VPQELFGTAALHELIEVMRTTFAGKVLAVPQIAVSLRLSVVEGTQASDELSDSRTAKGSKSISLPVRGSHRSDLVRDFPGFGDRNRGVS
jgi:hypothetical protein